MNVVFTIVARNYFSFALTLGQSIKETNPSLEYYILLADDANGIDSGVKSTFNIILASELGIPDFQQMSFKYDVTEFSTSIKPFFIDYLIKEKSADKIIYLDPDIYVYQSLEGILMDLEAYDVVITPHMLNMESQYTGHNPESEFLFAGIYNLGFIALKNSAQSLRFIEWWKVRLADLCFGDRYESLHVDQKWIDFLPAFFSPNQLLISRHPGLNIAYWNIHERELFLENSVLRARLKGEDVSEKVLFMHFSGVNPKDIYHNKQCAQIDIRLYPVWEQLIKKYSVAVMDNDFERYLQSGYGFNFYSNGDFIAPFHRRVFRRIIELNLPESSGNPFFTGSGTFHELIKSSRLLISRDAVATKVTAENYNSSLKSLRVINLILMMFFRVFGFVRYITLLRFSQKYFRPENQLFLLKKYRQLAVKSYFQKRVG